MVVFYKCIYTQILFVEVPEAPCCSLALLASWTLLFWTSWSWRSWLMLSDNRVVEDTYIFSLFPYP